MRIGIAFDLAPAVRPADGPDDRFEEFDRPETVEAIAAVLRGEGHEVVLLGDGREFLARVLSDPPDFVWNLAEGEGVGRCRESRVPAVLEMLDIPYSGSDPLTLALALDKPLAKQVVLPVRSPRGLAFGPGADRDEVGSSLSGGRCGPGPWVVKPAFEGSSKGIRDRSLADDPREAAEVCAELARTYHQSILIEEFIAGDEVTVGLVGNGPTLEVLGLLRVRPKSADPRFVYSLEVKRDWEARVVYETLSRDEDEGLYEEIARCARSVFLSLGCRDLARIDFRVRDGVPYFLEANPLPGLAPVTSDLVILAEKVGIGHADLIRRVLRAALGRVGLGPVA